MFRIELSHDEMLKMNQKAEKQKPSLSVDQIADSVNDIEFDKEQPDSPSGDHFSDEMVDKFSNRLSGTKGICDVHTVHALYECMAVHSFYSPEVEEVPTMKPYQSLGAKASVGMDDEDDLKSPPGDNGKRASLTTPTMGICERVVN